MEKESISMQFNDLEKSQALLLSSVDKFEPYDLEHIYTADELEYYDSLSYRFEKCVEMVLNFFRALELFLVSKQTDVLRDRLLVMEKLGLIENIDFWMEARLLRNKIAHAYLPEEIKDIYEEIVEKSNQVFATITRIKKYLAERQEKGT